MKQSPSDAQAFTIPGGTTGILYPPHPAGEQSIAIVEIHGNYPETGYSINDRCTETMICIEGEIHMEYDGQELTLNPDDICMVLPGKQYRTWGNGKLVVAISPEWESAQNHIIDENGKEIPKN